MAEQNITSGDGDQGASNDLSGTSGGAVNPENQAALEEGAAKDLENMGTEKDDPSRGGDSAAEGSDSSNG